jgi:hypothetical protein
MKKAVLIMVALVMGGIGLLCVAAYKNNYVEDPAFDYSYTVTTANSRYVFVMLRPSLPWRDLSDRDDARMEQSRKIQSRYRYSGLYLKDGPASPLWTIDHYSWEAYVSSDGSHVACPAPWPMSSSDEALTFYERGNILHAYSVKDLVDSTWLLPGGYNHYDWAKSMSLDDSHRTLTVTTEQFDKYVFDMNTGKIISAWRPVRSIMIFMSFALVFVTVKITKNKS